MFPWRISIIRFIGKPPVMRHNAGRRALAFFCLVTEGVSHA
jgi:hypothetical protein